MWFKLILLHALGGSYIGDLFRSGRQWENPLPLDPMKFMNVGLFPRFPAKLLTQTW